MFNADHLYWYQAVMNPSTRDPAGVVDGDTFNVVIDHGRFIYSHVALRLFGINAPEMSTQAGKDARVWAAAWFVTNVGPPGTPFIIHSIGLDPNDKYGRLLCDVFAPNGRWYNQDIKDAGHAVPYYP